MVATTINPRYMFTFGHQGTIFVFECRYTVSFVVQANITYVFQMFETDFEYNLKMKQHGSYNDIYCALIVAIHFDTH